MQNLNTKIRPKEICKLKMKSKIKIKNVLVFFEIERNFFICMHLILCIRTILSKNFHLHLIQKSKRIIHFKKIFKHLILFLNVN